MSSRSLAWTTKPCRFSISTNPKDALRAGEADEQEETENSQSPGPGAKTDNHVDHSEKGVLDRRARPFTDDQNPKPADTWNTRGSWRMTVVP